GYSRDAKRNGVLMIRDALIRHFGISPAGSTHPDQDPVPLRLPSLRAGSIPDPITPAWMEPVIAQVMDIRSDDARFRRLMLGAEDRTLAFHRYRASYPARYGWSRYSATPRSRAEEAMLKALGFGITAKEDAS
ncbi:MAG: DUF3410 domain-containing protein, partial [Bacteroidetes bacterium]|nr:DUF3410 domain-containing protein [Bacteroidota bacterium]